jgi:hypothetical protein
MCAAMVRHKEFAVTGVNAVLKQDMVIVIVAVKSKVEFVEEEAIPLLRIPFCFLSFSYHSVVHLRVSPFKIGIKKAREYTHALLEFLVFVGICSHRTFTSMVVV